MRFHKIWNGWWLHKGPQRRDKMEGSCMHAQEFTVPNNEFIEHNWFLAVKHNIYFDIHIQLLVTNGELLIIRAVIMSQECTQPSGYANVSKCLLQYSAKFSRRIIFVVFETFRLNFPGVRGIVWKQYDSYSTFAVLHGRQEQHGTLSLFQS